jgi:hypothetical protein
MLKQGFGTYARHQSPSIQQMQTLYFEIWPNSVVLKKRDVLHLTERTDTCITTTSALMPPEKLQVDRITNLPNHTPARINKKTT